MSTTISGTSGVTFPDSTSMQTGQQACKAWVNFNGTGTVAIRASYNVSSITDRGTGQYTLNFTNALVDANYSVSGTATGNGVTRVVVSAGAPSISASACDIDTGTGGTVYDNSIVMCAVFR